jgi:hypothetical protein
VKIRGAFTIKLSLVMQRTPSKMSVQRNNLVNDCVGKCDDEVLISIVSFAFDIACSGSAPEGVTYQRAHWGVIYEV